MSNPPGGGYPGPPSAPSAPSAPPAPGTYLGQQGGWPSNYGATPPSYSSVPSFSSAPPSTYSTAPPSTYGSSATPPTYGSSAPPSSYGSSAPPSSYGSSAPPSSYGSSAPPSTYGSSALPSSYGTGAPSLAYSNSQRNPQYNAQTSFSHQHAPPASPYGDHQHTNQSYGQTMPSGYGMPPTSQAPAGYNQGSYGDPSKVTPSYQSQSSFGQPNSYVQTQPGSYGQTTAPNSYGMPSGYGKQAPQQSYGQTAAASQYGQQSYGQVPQYSSSSYPPAYGAPAGGGKPKSQFPAGTEPDIVRAFELGDIDGSGLIDAAELGRVLSTGIPFSLRTVHLMLHLYSANGTEKIGPTEFGALWNALKEWKGCFERSDRDRSGRIDFQELRDGLLSMGYAISPPLLQILISKYDRTGQAKAIDYDNFVECGLVVKGLTDRFKAKDTRFTGSANLDYETFMTMVLPFIVA